MTDNLDYASAAVPMALEIEDAADGRADGAQSPALDLLDQIWKHWGGATRHSWDRVNRSMRAALELAVGSGMRFGPDDFDEIERRYRFEYWGGKDAGGFAEGFYRMAVTEGNRSAAQAFEKYKGRQPFIFETVDPGGDRCFRHRVSRRTKERAAVGFRIHWQGRWATVTSFADDGQSLTACTYREPDDGSSYRKIDKRFKITQADLRARRRAAASA
ncbi:MAG: hypothetical protein JXB13_01710 [Phycisphaerae bacterium]|nr:hypothetical protein [Phycisphaerae bacterium]